MRRAFIHSRACFAVLVAIGLIVGGSLPSAQVRQGSVVAPATGRDSRATSTGTAAIAGVVVAADTGRPVRRVRVTLSSTAPDVSLSATTADDGHFKFSDLPAGHRRSEGRESVDAHRTRWGHHGDGGRRSR